MSPLTVAVLGGGRWARALAALLAHHQRKQPGRIARVLHYRPPRPTPKAPPTIVDPDELSHQEALLPGAVVGAGAADAAASAKSPVAASGESGVVAIGLEELGQADLLFLAVPAASVRSLLRAASPALHGAQSLVHAVGSLAPVGEGETDNIAGTHHALISDVVRSETPIRRIGALAGPALAEDLEEYNPAALVCGSRYQDVCLQARQVLLGPALRLYTSDDLVGVEVARAMVSVVALASGVAHALDFGAAARAVLVTRGAAEMARLGVALGASERTFFGLAGVGELVVVTERRGSADFELGRLLVSGIPRGEAEAKVGRVCDGPSMVEEAYRIAQRHNLRMPLVFALHHWLAGQSDTKKALFELFSSETQAE